MLLATKIADTGNNGHCVAASIRGTGGQYFRDLADVTVMGKDQEFAAATRLVELRKALWTALLDYPPFVAAICALAGERLSADACPRELLADAERTARTLRDYTNKYCMEDSFITAAKRGAVENDGWTSYLYSENWISYIWSTGNNWSGPIGKFTLTIDKGDEDSLVSFCGDNVKKIGPTTFEMTETDWYPPWDRELEILILDKME